MMIWITIIFWIMALLYAYANGKRLTDQLFIITRGKDTWIGSENIFLLAAIIATAVDIVLLIILAFLYFLKAILQAM